MKYYECNDLFREFTDPLEIRITWSKWGIYIFYQKFNPIKANSQQLIRARGGKWLKIKDVVLTGQHLIDFRYQIAEELFSQFHSHSRSYKMSSQLPMGRCYQCSKLLLTKTGKYRWRAKFCNGCCARNFYSRWDWSCIRSDILIRDNYTCQHCKQQFPLSELEVDHIKEIASGKSNYESGKLFNDPNNLQTLCIVCHKKKTAKFNSKYLSELYAQSKVTLNHQQLTTFFRGNNL